MGAFVITKIMFFSEGKKNLLKQEYKLFYEGK